MNTFRLYSPQNDRRTKQQFVEGAVLFVLNSIRALIAKRQSELSLRLKQV